MQPICVGKHKLWPGHSRMYSTCRTGHGGTTWVCMTVATVQRRQCVVTTDLLIENPLQYILWLTCSTVNLHISWYPMRAFSTAHNNFTRKDILKLVIINWFGVEHQLLWSLEKELSNKASRSSWIMEVLATWFCVCMESSLSWSKICFRLNWACCAFGLPAGHHQPPASALPLHHLWHRDDCPCGSTDPHLPQDHHGRGRHQRRYKSLSWDTQLTSSSMSVWCMIYCTLWL